MVTRRDYEKRQIDAIVLEYTSRGYNVRREPKLPGLDLIPDLTAERAEPPEFVVIEIMNRRRDQQRATDQLQALSDRFAAILPGAVFDLRYLEDPEGAAALPRIAATQSLLSLRQPVAEDEAIGGDVLRSLLHRRLPAMPAELDGYLGTQMLMRDWVAFATLVRAFCLGFGFEPQTEIADTEHGDRDVLEMYNLLLSRLGFTAADDQVQTEASADELETEFHFLDLFEIRACVGVALEGGMVTADAARHMRRHLKLLRTQIFQRLP